MQATLANHRDRLACPRCHGPLSADDTQLYCTNTTCELFAQPFPNVAGSPALVDFDRSILRRDELQDRAGASPIARAETGLRARLGKLIHPKNRQAAQSIERMLATLRARALERRPLIVVVGGGVVGGGVDLAYAARDVDVLAFDIYRSSTTQLVADAHEIPFADESVDAVIVEAVLEHVLDPVAVVREIHRVLVPGGLVYSDTPFLQHVHEGPYDFTRFTESGHRYLYRDFVALDTGVVAGAGTQLVWSIDHFVRALCRSQLAGRAVALAFSWLGRLDPLLDPRFSVDAASSTYFLGEKSDAVLSPRAIVDFYHGAQTP